MRARLAVRDELLVPEDQARCLKYVRRPALGHSDAPLVIGATQRTQRCHTNIFITPYGLQPITDTYTLWSTGSAKDWQRRNPSPRGRSRRLLSPASSTAGRDLHRIQSHRVRRRRTPEGRKGKEIQMKQNTVSIKLNLQSEID